VLSGVYSGHKRVQVLKNSGNGTDFQTLQGSGKGFVAKPGARQMIFKHKIKTIFQHRTSMVMKLSYFFL